MGLDIGVGGKMEEILMIELGNNITKRGMQRWGQGETVEKMM